MGIKSNNKAESYFNFFGASGIDAVSSAPPPSSVVEATGGTTATYTDPTGSYKSHTFTGPGPFNVTVAGDVDYLVVGGGGGGGNSVHGSSNGGGAGAGGVLTGTSFAVTVQSYPITVGGGGSGNHPTGTDAGASSVFSTLTAQGGGGGGRQIGRASCRERV